MIHDNLKFCFVAHNKKLNLVKFSIFLIAKNGKIKTIVTSIGPSQTFILKKKMTKVTTKQGMKSECFCFYKAKQPYLRNIMCHIMS
jgi:hypothetical protein